MLCATRENAAGHIWDPLPTRLMPALSMWETCPATHPSSSQRSSALNWHHCKASQHEMEPSQGPLMDSSLGRVGSSILCPPLRGSMACPIPLATCKPFESNGNGRPDCRDGTANCHNIMSSAGNCYFLYLRQGPGVRAIGSLWYSHWAIVVPAIGSLWKSCPFRLKALKNSCLTDIQNISQNHTSPHILNQNRSSYQDPPPILF